MFLLSTKAGLRAKGIAELTWAMVTDGNGEIRAVIALENKTQAGQFDLEEGFDQRSTSKPQ